MQAETQDLIERLRLYPEKLKQWSERSLALKDRAQAVLRTERVDEEELSGIELSIEDLRREVTNFNTLAAEIAKTSTAASAELWPVGDTLRLLLLEITELSVSMYSVRSGLPVPA